MKATKTAPLNYVYVLRKGSNDKPKRVFLCKNNKEFQNSCKGFLKDNEAIGKIWTKHGRLVKEISRVHAGATLELEIVDENSLLHQSIPQDNLMNIKKYRGASKMYTVVEDDKENEEPENIMEGAIKFDFTSDTTNTTTKNQEKAETAKKKSIIKKASEINLEQALKKYTYSPTKLSRVTIDDVSSGSNSMMSTLSQWNTLGVDYQSIFNAFPEKEKEEIQNIFNRENEHANYWVRGVERLASEEFGVDTRFIQFLPDIIDHIKMKGMSANTRVLSKYIYHTFNLFIYGPNKSGRTTMLYLACVEAAKTLGIANEWKDNLFLPIDARNVIGEKPDAANMYHSLVAKTCNAIAAEFPIYARSASEVSHYLTKLPNLHPEKLFLNDTCLDPEFRKYLKKKIAEILEGMSEAFSSNDNQFLAESIWSIPQLLADAFGIKKLVYVMDNLEASDVTCTFSEETNSTFLSEIILLALASNQYITTIGDQKHFTPLCIPFTANGPNILSISQVVTTYDIIDEYSFLSRAIVVYTSGNLPIKIDIPMLGGIPAYVFKFQRVGELLDLCERCGDDDEQKVEALAEIDDIVSDLLSIVFPDQKFILEKVQLSSSMGF